MAKFKDYILMGGENREGLKRLHNLVSKHKEAFFSDNDVQDVLMNRGYNPEGERPDSFYNINDGVFLRTRTAVHLGFLEKMIEMATIPQLAVVRGEEDGIVSPEGKGVLYPNDILVKAELETPGGANYVRAEEFQERWFREPEAVENVRGFQECLTKAFEEFNLKLVLSRMYSSLSNFIPEDFGRVYKIHGEVIEAMGGRHGNRGELMNAMDNAYYNLARRFFNRAGNYWGKLAESDFGKKFVLSEEEEREAVKTVIRRGP